MTCGRSVVFSEYSVSSKNKTDRNDITEILMKGHLSTIHPNPFTTKILIAISDNGEVC